MVVNTITVVNCVNLERESQFTYELYYDMIAIKIALPDVTLKCRANAARKAMSTPFLATFLRYLSLFTVQY